MSRKKVDAIRWLKRLVAGKDADDEGIEVTFGELRQLVAEIEQLVRRVSHERTNQSIHPRSA